MEAIARPLLSGIVRSESGEAISGARLAWLALEAEDNEATPAWPWADWGVAPRLSVVTTSGANGEFDFEEPPSAVMRHGSAVFVLHRTHYPGGLDLPPDTETRDAGITIVLAQADPIHVQVIDPGGLGQGGALLHHASRPHGQSPDAARAAPKWERFLYQEVVVDSNGEASIAPFRGEQAFWAEKDDLASIPWVGPRPSRVELVLGESFTVGGLVALPDWSAWDPDYEGERRILVSGLTGNLWRPLVRLRDVEEGPWGPLRVPLAGAERFRVRFEGLPIVPIEEAFDPPPPSSHRRIDFHAEKQAELWFLAQDENEQPIPSARAVVWWNNAKRPSDPEHAKGAAKPDGTLYVGSFPPGTVSYRVSAPGYGDFEGMVNVPHEGLLVTLLRGGLIRGRCMHEGRPVRDFEIHFWLEGKVRVVQMESFFDRENGTFELDSLNPGDWSLHAVTPDSPGGKVVSLRVRRDEVSEVELEIPSPIRGAGRVVDAETGQPVGEAAIQAYSSGGLERGPPWGKPVLAASDGTFEMQAFVLGSNYIRVAAQGYADTDAKAVALGADLLDWGDIRMHRPQTLVVSLEGFQDLPFDVTELRARTFEGHILPERRFAADGTVRFEGVAPGEYRLALFYPDESWARMHLDLTPGREWRYIHRIAGERRLTVTVLDAHGDPPSFLATAMLTGQESTGIFTVRMNWNAKGNKISFDGITSDSVQLWVMNGETAETLATRDVSFGANAALDLVVRIGEQPLRVHVVDARGTSLPGAWVTLRSSDGSKILGLDDTDSGGWAFVHGAPPGNALLDVSHGIAGRRLGVPVDASVGEMQIELDANGSLEFHLADGDEPLAGVALKIESSGGVTLSEVKHTDARGLTRFEPVGQGAYHVSCERVDCWTTYVDEELDPDEHASVNVQMRRLADLELLLLNREGIPVSGMPLVITSDEFGVSLDVWLAQARIRSESGSTTDTRGRITVEGIPRGTYLWSVTLEGVVTSGSFVLHPTVRNAVTLRLPL